MDLQLLKTVRDYHYFYALVLENVSIHHSFPAIGPTQSVHAKICITRHQPSECTAGSDSKFREYLR